MSFVEDNLEEGEEIKYEAHLHNKIYDVVGIIFLIFVMIFLLSGGFLLLSLSGYLAFGDLAFISLIPFMLVAFSLYWGLQCLNAKKKNELVVTNRKIIINVRVLNISANNVYRILLKKFHILDLDKCDSILVTQGFMGKKLGYGGIVIGSGGSTIVIKYIDNPYKFRDEINKQIENLSNGSKVNVSVNNTNSSRQVAGGSLDNTGSETKRCPYCGEEINVNAKKCRHCKEWLN